MASRSHTHTIHSGEGESLSASVCSSSELCASERCVHRGACEVIQKVVVLQACALLLALWAAGLHLGSTPHSAPEPFHLVNLVLPRRCCETARALHAQATAALQQSLRGAASRSVIPQLLLVLASPEGKAHSVAALVSGVPTHVVFTALHLLRCSLQPFRNLGLDDAVCAAMEHVLRGHPDWCAGAAVRLARWANAFLAAESAAFLAAALSTTIWVPPPRTPAPQLPGGGRAVMIPATGVQLAFPELTRLEVAERTGPPAACITRGCPHPWFCEAMPAWLLAAAHERSAASWYPFQLRRRCLERWRRRRGMRLLLRMRDALDAGSEERTGVAASSRHDVSPEATPSSITAPSQSWSRSASSEDMGAREEEGNSVVRTSPSAEPQSSGAPAPTRPTPAPTPLPLRQLCAENEAAHQRDALQRWMRWARWQHQLLVQCDAYRTRRLCRAALRRWADGVATRLRHAKREAMDALLQEKLRRRDEAAVVAAFAVWRAAARRRQWVRDRVLAPLLSRWRAAARLAGWQRGRRDPPCAAGPPRLHPLLLWRQRYRVAVADRWRRGSVVANVCRRLAHRAAGCSGYRAAVVVLGRGRLHALWHRWAQRWRWRRLLCRCAEVQARLTLQRVWRLWRRRLSSRRRMAERNTIDLHLAASFECQRRLAVVFGVWRRRFEQRKKERAVARHRLRRSLRRWGERLADRRRAAEQRTAAGSAHHDRRVARRCWCRWTERCEQRWSARRATADRVRDGAASTFCRVAALSRVFFRWRLRQLARRRRRSWHAEVGVGAPLGLAERPSLTHSHQWHNAATGDAPPVFAMELSLWRRLASAFSRRRGRMFTTAPHCGRLLPVVPVAADDSDSSLSLSSVLSAAGDGVHAGRPSTCGLNRSR
eukprot:gene7232-5083_t